MVSRRARWLGSLALTVTLLGSVGDARAQRPRPARHAQRPRPAKDGLTRWLGSLDVPLLAAGHGTIKAPGDDACTTWAPRGTRWRAVDAWGQIVGRASIKEAGKVDRALDTCYYPVHQKTDGAEGVLLASAEGPWQPGPSAEWKPSAAERERLKKFVAATASVLGVPPSDGRNIRFFALKNDILGEQQRFAVVGGRALLVARLGKDGRWTITWSDAQYTRLHLRVSGPDGGLDAYAPLAIFDMNGEGAPEVIYRWSSGADSGLGVLEFDPITEQLHLVTTSAYGTTA